MMDLFPRVWRGYDPTAVETKLRMLEARIGSLERRVTAAGGPPAPAADDDAIPDPEGVIHAARWDAEKIRLEAQAKAEETMRLAEFRRDMMLRAAQERVVAMVREAEVRLAAMDTEPGPSFAVDLHAAENVGLETA